VGHALAVYELAGLAMMLMLSRSRKKIDWIYLLTVGHADNLSVGKNAGFAVSTANGPTY